MAAVTIRSDFGAPQNKEQITFLFQIKGRGTENPQGIWLWRPVGFDYITSTGLGNQRLLEDTNYTLYTPGPRRKEKWLHKRLSQTGLERSGVSGRGVGGLPQGHRHWPQQSWEAWQADISPFGGDHHDPYHSLVSGQTTGREHSSTPSEENWIKDLLSMALPTKARPSFPHSQSLPSGSFHKPLILIHQRADRMKTTVTEN